MKKPTDNETKTGGCGSLPLATGSAPSFDSFWKDHDGETVEKEPTAAQSRAHARKHTLNAKLRTLSEWAKNRADNPHHDVSTTISMLRRKVGEIDDAVARASLLPNAQSEPAGNNE
jgi:hypothetical protein